MTILEKAQLVVDGQRAKEYGDLKKSFLKISNLWEAYLGIPISKLDVAHLMMLLKISRGYHGYKEDSILDIIGYAYCADKIYNKDSAQKEIDLIDDDGELSF